MTSLFYTYILTLRQMSEPDLLCIYSNFETIQNSAASNTGSDILYAWGSFKVISLDVTFHV